MSYTKITEADLTGKGVTGLPDTPNLSTSDMQAKFDELVKDVVVPKHNTLIDELEASTGASSVGAKDINGANSTVQNEFDNRYAKSEINVLLENKVDKEVGKGLSTFDFTKAYKNKLNGIEDNANNYVLPKGTQTTLGGVKGDGETFTIDENGVGHAIGGGGGGTANYNALVNKPTVNGVTVIGGKASEEYGLLRPYLVVTSEAGSTITISKGGKTITATQKSGSTTQWEVCPTSYGTWTVSSDLPDADIATTTIVIDAVKMYAITVEHIAATITATYQEGATCVCKKGTTVYTATSNPQTFTVRSIGNWTVETVYDGITKSVTVPISADEQTESVTLEYATIEVTYGNDFRGTTITCASGATVYSKTAPSSGNTVSFTIASTGTWVVSGTVSGDTYTRTQVVSEMTTYPVILSVFNATVTVTFPYSKGASCTITDGVTTLTATTSPMAFNVPNAETWTATCTLGGISKTSSVEITTDGQTESVTFEFGTINLTFANEFRGLNITATDGISTIVKQAPMSGNTMVLYPNATGNWTISGTYSGTTYVSYPNPVVVSSLSTPVSATLQSFIIYGFEIESTESDPSSNISYAVQYDGENVENYNYTPAYMDYTNNSFNYGSWENAFFMPRPCMLKNDGTVDYYLNPNDYTKKADGTASDVADTSYGGNAMMEWGKGGRKIWYKIVPDSTNNGATVYISDKQVDSGFHAYSFTGSDGTTLNDHFYTPIYNGSVVNSKLRSISGQTIMNNVAGGTEITYATANGTGYYIETFADRILINLLLMLIGKNTNTQATFGNGHYTGGSAAGDLLKSGTMNDKGLFYGTSGTGVGVKVFGMENWWGNQWRRTAGLLNVSGAMKYKLTAPYNDSGSNYNTVSGGTPDGTSSGYVNKMIYTSDGAMTTKTASGSDSTFYADGMWFNNSQTDYALFGGVCSAGLLCGAFACFLADTLSLAHWTVGAALSYHE